MKTRLRTAPAHRPWWPALIIPAAACVFCWPVFLGRIMLPADMCLLMLPWQSLMPQFPGFERVYNPMFDPIQQYLPWRIYAVESLRAGFIPLWNPYAFCGTPFLANLQSTVLYPLNLLFLITGARHGFGISAVLHLTLGGLFMYAFLRALALRPAASLFGALILMFGGFTVTWLEFPAISLWVLMWLPAVLLCYERSLHRPRSVWPVLCALAVALQFLGGHLQIAAYVVIAFAIYALVQMIGRRQGIPVTRAAALAALPLALGLLLAAGQILPTLELAEHSGRVPHGAGAAVSTAFPLTHFILYLAPNFFGNPVHYNYWGNFRDPSAFNFFETACYVGILPLFLAVWALRRWRERHLWFFLILTLFAVLAAVGSPIYLLLYYVVPGFRELAGLARILCLASFGLAGLAALGLDDLLSDHRARSVRYPILLMLAITLGAWAAAARFLPLLRAGEMLRPLADYTLRQLLIALGLAAVCAVLIGLRLRGRLGGRPFAWCAVALLVADLFAFGLRFNPFVDARMAYPQTDTTRWLQTNAAHWRVTSLVSDPGKLDWMPHNSPMVFGLRDIHGSDSLRVRRSFDLVSGPNLDQSNYPLQDSPLLDVLGVRYLITRREVAEAWSDVGDAEGPIHFNLEAMARANVVYGAVAADDRQALAALLGPSHSFRRTALVPPETASLLKLQPKGPRRSMGSPCWFERDDPDAVTVQLDAEYDSLLVLTDSFYPGWRAWVDGDPAPIYRVNYGFRGIPVPAGEHTVELRYDPASFRVGAFLSLLALAALAGWSGALCLARASSTRPTSRRS
jgi:hypothetical protein